MKKYVFSTLLAMALACSAHAVTDNNDNGRPGNPGHVNKVPDTGSTAALLGLAGCPDGIGATHLCKGSVTF